MSLEILNKEFNNYDEVFNLSFKYDFINQCYNLEIILADNLRDFIESKFLKVLFFNVSDLNISKLNGIYNQFFKMLIVNNDEGLENVFYELIQTEEDNIYCKFRDYSFELLSYIEWVR